MSFLPLTSGIPMWGRMGARAPIAGPTNPMIPGMNPMGLQTGMGGLLENPLFGAGMGLLSANTPSPHPVNYAQGLMGGLAMSQNAQANRSQAETQKARYDIEMKRLAQEQEKWAKEREQERMAAEGSQRLSELIASGAPREQIAAEMASMGDTSMLSSLYKEPAQTSAMQNYELAKSQGYTGSFIDYQTQMANARQPVTNINNNMGAPFKIPNGYMLGPDGVSVVPIPGGPTDPNTPKPPGAEIQRMNIATSALEDGLSRYSEMLDSFNPRNPMDQFNPEKTAAIDTLVADIRMQAKEAAALGALTGPDLEILDKMLADPVSLRGAWRGRGGLKAQIEEYRKSIARRQAATDEVTGRNPVSATGEIAPSRDVDSLLEKYK